LVVASVRGRADKTKKYEHAGIWGTVGKSGDARAQAYVTLVAEPYPFDDHCKYTSAKRCLALAPRKCPFDSHGFVNLITLNRESSATATGKTSIKSCLTK